MRPFLPVIGIAMAVTSAAVAGPTDASVILKKRGIFSAEPPPPAAAVRSILRPQPPASLDTLLEVVGIVFLPSGGSQVFIRRVRTGEEAIYGEGDTVERAVITKIGPETVTFRYEDREVELNLERQVTPVSPAAGAGPGSGNAVRGGGPTVFAPSGRTEGGTPGAGGPMPVRFKPTIDALMADRELQRKVSVLPSVVDGKVQGFRVDNIPEDSIPYQYGLRNGDIIHKVNGVLIDSLARGMAVYREIERSGTKTVTVEIIRGGQPVTLTYQLQ